MPKPVCKLYCSITESVPSACLCTIVCGESLFWKVVIREPACGGRMSTTIPTNEDEWPHGVDFATSANTAVVHAMSARLSDLAHVPMKTIPLNAVFDLSSFSHSSRLFAPWTPLTTCVTFNLVSAATTQRQRVKKSVQRKLQLDRSKAALETSPGSTDLTRF